MHDKRLIVDDLGIVCPSFSVPRLVAWRHPELEVCRPVDLARNQHAAIEQQRGHPPLYHIESIVKESPLAHGREDPGVSSRK
jgi:hypothetical protein